MLPPRAAGKKSPAERGAARNGAGFPPPESERAAAIMLQASRRHVTVTPRNYAAHQAVALILARQLYPNRFDGL